MIYFGYGSNLNLAELARWCSERDLRHEGVRPIERAWLPDEEVVFHYRSRARNGGALSIRPRRGAAVPGMIFEVDEAGWEALDRKEGAPSYYERVRRVAIAADGREVEVTTYEVVPERRLAAHVPPTDAYVRSVREGLASHGLPDAHVLAAARSLEAPAEPSALFVYGTLRRGELRAPLLARHRPRRWCDARTRGRLVHLGEYPGLLPCDRGLVRGELVELDEPSEALAELDEVEEFLGYGVGGSLYRRVLVEVEPSDGPPTLAWTYRYLGDAGTPIGSGDWRAR